MFKRKKTIELNGGDKMSFIMGIALAKHLKITPKKFAKICVDFATDLDDEKYMVEFTGEFAKETIKQLANKKK